MAFNPWVSWQNYYTSASATTNAWAYPVAFTQAQPETPKPSKRKQESKTAVAWLRERVADITSAAFSEVPA